MISVSNQFMLILNFIASDKMLLFCAIIGILIKTYLLYFSSRYALKSRQFNSSFLIFLLIIIGTIFEDLAWSLKLLRSFGVITNYNLVVFIIRLAWVFCIIHYQALINFSNLLISFNYQSKTSKYLAIFIEKSLLIISFITMSIFTWLSIFKFNLIDLPRYKFDLFCFKFIGIYNEINLIHFVYWYLLIISFLNLILLFWKLYIANSNQINVPSLVRKQVKILLLGIIGPKLLSEFIQAYQFSTYNSATLIQPLYSISCLLSIGMFYFCIKRILGLRLLNFNPEPNNVSYSKFISEFKDILDQLSHVQATTELNYIVQRLFEKSFGILPRDTILYLRTQNNINQSSGLNKFKKIDKSFDKSFDKSIESLLMLSDNKVINYEELEINNFYDKQANHEIILELMRDLKLIILIPIKYQEHTLGAVCIKENNYKIFNKIENDEILMFVRYLANTIYTIQQQTIYQLLNKSKSLEEELYNKHCEIEQYKESLRSLLKNNTDQLVGVLYYSNRKFIFANQAAKNMINFNINQQDGHPFTRILKQLAQQVEQYKIPQTKYYSDVLTQKKYLISVLPNLEQNNIIITLNYAEATDIIKAQLNSLKNPTDWDYLLYLETTKSGILINNLIPGNSEILINLKIDLLKLALTKKAILIKATAEDSKILVNLINHISLKEDIKFFNSCSNISLEKIKIELFGSKQLLAESEGILENFSGNLVINHLENIPLSIQDDLADIVSYGIFYPYKSDFSVKTESRLIFTTEQNLDFLLNNGKISLKLYKEIQTTAINFPSLKNLNEKDLLELANGIAEKSTNYNKIGNLFELQIKDKEKIINQKPDSLTSLTNIVNELISKKINIFENQDLLDPAFNITDPSIIEAAKLGKKALKNPVLMNALWQTFKNQNQIADFLKVNRSSVNRRCREFQII
jgi:transcriptional regulator of aromatic amino acid metabolism